MKTRYIEAFFSKKNMKQTLDSLFNDYISGKPVDFIKEFSLGEKFLDASDLVKETRAIVTGFIEKVFDKESPQAQSADSFWHERREELFSLQYLCVEANKQKSDSKLLAFLTALHIGGRLPGWELLSNNKKFNDLIIELKQLLEKVNKSDSYKLKDTPKEVKLALILERDKEMEELRAQTAIVALQLQQKDALIEVKEQEIKEIRKELALATTDNEQLASKVKQMEEKNAKLDEKYQSIEVQLVETKKVNEELLGTLDGTQKQLNEMEEKRIKDKEEQKKMVETEIAKQMQALFRSGLFPGAISAPAAAPAAEKVSHSASATSAPALQSKDQNSSSTQKRL